MNASETKPYERPARPEDIQAELRRRIAYIAGQHVYLPQAQTVASALNRLHASMARLVALLGDIDPETVAPGERFTHRAATLAAEVAVLHAELLRIERAYVDGVSMQHATRSVARLAHALRRLAGASADPDNTAAFAAAVDTVVNRQRDVAQATVDFFDRLTAKLGEIDAAVS